MVGRRKRGKRGHLSPQRTFPFKRRDGHRIGRPKKADSGVSHLEREKLAARYPVHVVMRLEKGLPRLRSKKPYQVLRRCFAKGRDRFGFRLNHYSVQGNHLHFIVEAKDRVALSKGMNGLNVRIARGLNKLWGRKGKVFADRYFARILRSPREVKNALRYVLKNAARHGQVVLRRVDIFTSGMWFDGWRGLEPRDMDPGEPPCVAPARTWLQRTGWRRYGLLVIDAA